ncbi:MAG TPA: hypothetical protein VKV15_02225 [Bryobacteraceae bacterium]|nr:hypothetical protein [Bryobacteraceae bacterium]
MTPARLRAGRTAYYLFPCLFCLAVYWSTLRGWFWQDDFAWLGLSRELHGWRDLFHTLFEPMAQGTVRVFSERIFFLAMHAAFGLQVLPFHAVVFLTQFGNLVLLAAIAGRLTGSRFVGFLAPLLWTANAALSTSLSWVSAYNQVLCAFCLLAAFYFLLRYIETNDRKFLLAQWIAFLFGFGVLETVVVYPALAALYTFCFARRHFRTTWPLFIPSVVFAILHILYIPTVASPVYAFHFGSSLAATFSQYVLWSLGPIQLGALLGELWFWPGVIGTAAIGLALAGFAAWQLWKRNWLAVFCLGWFCFLLLPVLPLRNHISDYYLTSPIIGFAILGAWAFASAWENGAGLRTVALLLGVFYLCGSIAEIRCQTHWFLEQSRRFQNVFQALAVTHARHPDNLLLISGVDNELFGSGFQDQPFRLFGVEQVYLTPGSEAGIHAREDLGGITPFLMSTEAAGRAIERGKAQVLAVSGNEAHLVTHRYGKVLSAEYLTESRGRIDVGNPQFATRLGPGWYQEENGFRWMSKRASVRLAGPNSPGCHLMVNGYAPVSVMKHGPMTLHIAADGYKLGSAVISQPDRHFQLQFRLPGNLIGRYTIDITLEVDRTRRVPGDIRDLGLIFGTLAIQ